MSEIALQEKMLAILKSDGNRWHRVPISNSTSEARTLFDVIGARKYDLDFELAAEKVLLEPTSGLSVEMFGGLKPDIILRSKGSGQNRLIIEVKVGTKPTHKEADASQFLRYFLHLLVTSDLKPKGQQDISRGVFVVAPRTWFERDSLSATWRHLVRQYGGLAKQFQVTLGEIRAEHLEAAIQ